MLKVSNKYANANNASVRRFKAKVEVYANNALAFTYTQNDALKSISIERLGADSKFFGFGISTKMNIHLRDVLREINISTANTLKIHIGIVEAGDTVEYLSFPVIHVTEVNRDENTNELSITGYDVLEYSKGRTVSELNLTAPYTIGTFIAACGNLLGVNTSFTSELSNVIEINYPDGANFEGTENIRDALTSAAEAIQAIYYIDGYNQLTVKRLSKNGDPVKTISRDDYITLDSGNNRRLQTICHATELGDNVSASTTQIGTTQYVRDNPFWELRDDIATLVNDALEAVGDMTINQFECNWRGCLALEPGDKIKLITKDNKSVISYVLNDTLTYNGGLTQKTQWNYTESENTESNATSLGEVLKQTYARVDKANKQIELLAGEVDANNNAISSIMVNTDSILSSVQRVETATQESLDSIHKDVNTLTSKVEAQLTAEDVKLEIKSELANGVDKVETNTGFTFNDEGLTISKTGSEMTTQITEDGMTVNRDNEEMLTANNEGVIAVNLHAKTYLIIGGTSRFEDYQRDGETRTGCFWIGDTGV